MQQCHVVPLVLCPECIVHFDQIVQNLVDLGQKLGAVGFSLRQLCVASDGRHREY